MNIYRLNCSPVVFVYHKPQINNNVNNVGAIWNTSDNET